MNKIIPDVVLLVILSLSTVIIIPNIHAFSEENPTEKNTLNVKLNTEPEDPQPGEDTKLNIEFINPQTSKIQQHIDYTIKIENNENEIFGPIPLTHTSVGSVSIPVTLENGKNTITIDVEGILFQPIPKEMVTFDVLIGKEQSADTNKSDVTNDDDDNSNQESKDTNSNETLEQEIPGWVKQNAGWWANDEIDDNTFVSGIQYLIKNGIISVSSSSTTTTVESTTSEIPGWIKNNADWWAQGMISDTDFLKGIEFLVSNGIIVV